MKTCKYYEEKKRIRPLYNRYTGFIESHYEQIYGVCTGTKECEEVDCKGNEKSTKCEYYYERHKQDR